MRGLRLTVLLALALLVVAPAGALRELPTEWVTPPYVADGYGGGLAWPVDLSTDGRLAAFTTDSDRMVPGDAWDTEDLFVRDLATGTTTRVTSVLDGTSVAFYPGFVSASPDLRWFAFATPSQYPPDGGPGYNEVYVLDAATGGLERATTPATGAVPNGFSARPQVTADGTRVFFLSQASNLGEPGDSRWYELYVRDLEAGTTALVPSPNDLFYWDIDAEGRTIAFDTEEALVPGDTNDGRDVYVRDLASGATVRASVRTDGSQADGYAYEPVLSDDGRVVVFQSTSSDIAPGAGLAYRALVARDLATGVTEVVDVGDAAPTTYDLSPDGRFVAVTGYVAPRARAETWLADRLAGTAALASLTWDGVPAGSGNTVRPHVSADGSRVAFHSTATGLVPEDPSGHGVYVRHMDAPFRTATLELSPGDPHARVADQGRVQVAILSRGDVLAATVDPESLTFGRFGHEASVQGCPSARDVDRDGIPDLVCLVDMAAAGFTWGVREAVLVGELVDGTPIGGRVPVTYG